MPTQALCVTHLGCSQRVRCDSVDINSAGFCIAKINMLYVCGGDSTEVSKYAISVVNTAAQTPVAANSFLVVAKLAIEPAYYILVVS